MNPNIFFSNFSGASGKSRQNPGISRQKKFDSLGFEGHTELFGPHPFTWKTPTPPENIRTQKFRFGFFFRALYFSLPFFAILPPPYLSSNFDFQDREALAESVLREISPNPFRQEPLSLGRPGGLLPNPEQNSTAINLGKNARGSYWILR